MGNPAVLISNGPSTSPFSDQLKGEAAAYISTGLSLNECQRRLKAAGWARVPSLETLSDWRQELNVTGLTFGQSNEIALRCGVIQHRMIDHLADIADKPEILKHGFLVNAMRGTALDKVRDSANVNVNLSVDVQLNQVITGMGEAELERFISRGQTSVMLPEPVEE